MRATFMHCIVTQMCFCFLFSCRIISREGLNRGRRDERRTIFRKREAPKARWGDRDYARCHLARG